ncbi:MAG: Asp-tRNA(Asn)/Glu-tRNA(Gln) amidotransferase subunit GatB, partial [Thermodesulfobacteriota bacterium]
AENDAVILSSSKPLSDYFENCLKHFNNPKALGNWIINELLSVLKDEDEIENFPVKPKKLAELMQFVEEGKINGKIAKEIFPEMISSGKPADVIISEKNLIQITNQSEIELIIEKIIKNNPLELERYRKGEEKLFGFFVGQAMKETKGKANPKIVNEILKKLLIRD